MDKNSIAAYFASQATLRPARELLRCPAKIRKTAQIHGARVEAASYDCPSGGCKVFLQCSKSPGKPGFFARFCRRAGPMRGVEKGIARGDFAPAEASIGKGWAVQETEKVKVSAAENGVVANDEVRHFGFARFAAAGSAVVMAGLMLVPLAALSKEEASAGVAALLVGTMLIFAFALLIVLQRLKWQGPVLSVGPQGICDRRIGPGFIPWERIREIYLFRARSQLYLAVIPDDPGAFIDPPDWLFGFFVRANSWLRMPLLSISLTGLDAPRRQVINTLRAHLPAHLADDGGAPGERG